MRLRTLLIAAFCAAAAAPAGVFMVWVQHAALQREKDAVHDKHLNMARHLASTVEVVVRDRMEVLRRYAVVASTETGDQSFRETAAALGFRHLCLFDAPKNAIAEAVEFSGRNSLTPALAGELARQAPTYGAPPQVLPARRDAQGRPTIFIVWRANEALVAIGALSTGFVADIGASVVFGERGHAVVVDQTGQALAHPRPDWQAEIRDIRQVEPVAAMLDGQEGVLEFHSPALDEAMISGFAVSNDLGWGAMVVQPVQELHASAGSFFLAAFAIVAPLTLLAGLLGGGLVARLVARPVEQVAHAAANFAAGDHRARADESARGGVEETAMLAKRFNAMADAVCKHEDSLKTSLDQARVADRAKTAFLANMSHELRTPLNAVIGFSEVIASEMLGAVGNKKYREYANDIAGSARHLLSLINDVLDLSKVEADRIEIDLLEFDVVELLDAAETQISGQARENGVQVAVVKPATPLRMVADQRRVLQILLNLLSNSVRFTRRGGMVTVKTQLADGDIRFVVADTGIGMSTEDIALAIQPFGQPNDALDAADRGCGLGLPLARNLARAHGGELTLESEPGKGCVAIVQIPLRPAAHRGSRAA